MMIQRYWNYAPCMLIQLIAQYPSTFYFHKWGLLVIMVATLINSYIDTMSRAVIAVQNCDCSQEFWLSKNGHNCWSTAHVQRLGHPSHTAPVKVISSSWLLMLNEIRSHDIIIVLKNSLISSEGYTIWTRRLVREHLMFIIGREDTTHPALKIFAAWIQT